MGHFILVYFNLLFTIFIFSVACCDARTAARQSIPNFATNTNLPERRVNGEECHVNLKQDLPSNQPLILRKNGKRDLTGFYEPDPQGTIHFRPGEQMVIACPGRSNAINKLGVAQVTASCNGGNNFLAASKQLTFKEFNCTSFVSHSAQKNTSEKCEIPGDYIVIDIGYELEDKSFYTIMKTCFDEKNSDAIYAKFLQTPSISAAQVGEPRPTFIEGKFYPGITVNSKYVKEGQKNTFAQILGSKELANKYIGEGDFYLARGHLTARADYIFSSQQRATFWYVNVAPQWQTFNGGNWMQLESSVRSFTASSGLNLTIYTGTHGIATLPDVNNQEKQLFLDIDSGVGKIKVPEVFWKVLYEPKSQSAIAFVGVNNPYVSDLIPLCTDVCDQVQWLRWHPNNQKLGYGYCCDVNELRKTIKTIPKFKVVDLLT